MNNLLRKIAIGSVILGLGLTALPALAAVSAGCKADLSTCTSAELAEYIAELTAFLTGLQAQVTQSEGTTPTTGGYTGVPADFTFTKNLSTGMKDADVVNLKKVLDVEVADHAAWTGTNYFGSKVKAAVVKFQKKYIEEISELAGYTIKASGFVGAGTRAQLNELLAVVVVTPECTKDADCATGKVCQAQKCVTPTLPSVVSLVSPTANSTGVAVSSNITATFSVDLNATTVDATTVKVVTGTTTVAGAVSYANKVVTLDPTANLAYNTAYTVTLTTGIKKTDGNAALTTDYTWSFTTQAAPAVGAGLTVELAADTPAAATIIADFTTNDGAQALIPFAKIKFTNGDASDVKVTTLKFTRTGISADTDLSNIYIYDGETRLAEMTSFTNKVVTLSASAGLFTVATGGSKVITLKSDLTNDTAAGKTIAFQLAASTDITSNASAVNGTFPAAGNAMTVARVSDFGQLTITHSSQPAAVDPSLDTERELWRFSLAASAQKIKISYLNFTFIGTADASAFKELNLYVGGVKVAGPVEMASTKTATFDLSASPVILTAGQTKSATLNGKVVAGAGRDFYASFQSSSDIVAYDMGYGAYLKPNRSDVFSVLKASAATTINQGTLTVTRCSDSPSTNVALAGTDVLLACFDFKAAGEAIKITSLPADINNAASTTKTISNVYLTLDGSQIGVADTEVLMNGAEDIGWGSFGNAFMVSAGATAKVGVKANIVAGSNTSAALAANDTVLVQLETPGSDNAKRMTSGTTLSTPAYNGYTLTVKSGVVSITKNLGLADGSATAPTGVTGGTGVKIASFVVTAGASEGVSISQIVLQDNATTSLPTYFQNLTLKDADGNQIGSVVGTLTATANTTYSFVPSTSLTIAVGSYKVFNVYADIKSGLSTATLTAPIKVNAVYATGLVTAGSANDTTSLPALQNAYVAAGGALTVSKDAGAPSAAILVMGSTAQVMTKIKFEETSRAENIEVTQLVITDTFGSSAPTSSVSNITIEGEGLSATKAALTAAGTATFDLTSSPWIILAGKTKVLTVKADIANYPSANSGGTQTFNIAASGVTARGAVSKTSITGQPAATAGDVAMFTYATKPTLALNSSSPAAGNRTQSTADGVLVFNVTANAAKDVLVQQGQVNEATATSSDFQASALDGTWTSGSSTIAAQTTGGIGNTSYLRATATGTSPTIIYTFDVSTTSLADYTGISFWVRSNEATSSVILTLNDLTDTDQTVNSGTLAANTWTYVELTFTKGTNNANVDSISTLTWQVSPGFNTNTYDIDRVVLFKDKLTVSLASNARFNATDVTYTPTSATLLKGSDTVATGYAYISSASAGSVTFVPVTSSYTTITIAAGGTTAFTAIINTSSIVNQGGGTSSDNLTPAISYGTTASNGDIYWYDGYATAKWNDTPGLSLTGNTLVY